MSTGASYEQTRIEVDNVNAKPEERFANLNNHDILPALNLTREFGDHTNFRFGYGRTIARPTFRELARFASFDFQGDFILIGNPMLKRSVIDNLDLRYEIFPRTAELISVSAFYKRFSNPIERVVIGRAGGEAANGKPCCCSAISVSFVMLTVVERRAVDVDGSGLDRGNRLACRQVVEHPERPGARVGIVRGGAIAGRTGGIALLVFLALTVWFLAVGSPPL